MSKNTEVAIAINDIHKEFILPQSKHTSMKQAAVNIVKKNKKVTQKVLDGVSFEIKKGDFFGIVGRNGSGKSTLLKLIAGVYYPTSGSVDVNGGLTPFIELGVGFNPELSGHDNVYLNGALLGFTRTQMDEMYDEIVDFAELGPFMDQKLKNYSSGMQVRLAFSIAIKAKNDILIFDEVLAVGDEAFQRKCLDVFETYKVAGQTVILVTHDMPTVKRFCTKAALISDGKLVEFGDAHKVAQLYSKLNNQAIDEFDAEKNSRLQAKSILTTRLYDEDMKPVQRVKQGEKLVVDVSWPQLDKKLESIGINIFKMTGEHITGHNTRFADDTLLGEKNSVAIEYVMDIAPGKYFVYCEAFLDKDTALPQEFDGPVFSVDDTADRKVSGIFDLPHAWRRTFTAGK